MNEKPNNTTPQEQASQAPKHEHAKIPPNPLKPERLFYHSENPAWDQHRYELLRELIKVNELVPQTHMALDTTSAALKLEGLTQDIPNEAYHIDDELRPAVGEYLFELKRRVHTAKLSSNPIYDAEYNNDKSKFQINRMVMFYDSMVINMPYTFLRNACDIVWGKGKQTPDKEKAKVLLPLLTTINNIISSDDNAEAWADYRNKIAKLEIKSSPKKGVVLGDYMASHFERMYTSYLESEVVEKVRDQLHDSGKLNTKAELDGVTNLGHQIFLNDKFIPHPSSSTYKFYEAQVKIGL